MRFLFTIFILALIVKDSLQLSAKVESTILKTKLNATQNACGWRQDDSIRAKWPWHGTLYFNHSITLLNLMKKIESLGVTILTNRFLVTTVQGYVIYLLDPVNLRVRFGQPAVGESDEFTQDLPIEAAFVSSEDFEEPRRLVMFKLNGHIQFSKYVQPICLWQRGTLLNEIGYFVSFGGFNQGDQLQEIAMPIASKAECVNDHAGFEVLFQDSQTFCAGARNGSGPELQDVGAGLFVRNGTNWNLRGLLLWVVTDENQISSKTNYVMFLDVSNFSNWVMSTIENNS